MKRLLAALVVASVAQFAWAAGDSNLPAGAPLTGKVLEVKDVDPYTYMRLKTAKGETWAAVNKAPVKTGAEVTIENTMLMRNFESKTLKRTFETIVFGTLAGSAGASTQSGKPAMQPAPTASPKAGDLGKIHGDLAKEPVVAGAKVEKAEGANAKTVAEIHAGRKALKDKPVTVRAKVVKVTTNVMNRNWIHLRDGSGSPADNSDDILVTTKDTPKVGDVVVAKGVVRTDVKLGSGYAYDVLVEGSSVK